MTTIRAYWLRLGGSADARSLGKEGDGVMLISRKLQDPCPNCSQVGTYGNINVRNNMLRRGCSACNSIFQTQLPDIQKRIIYLDQFFYSQAFKESNPKIVELTNRIKAMAAKQMVVVPWSEIHELETHLWFDTRQKDLWDFVKQTARGHKFKQLHDIKFKQLKRAFDNAFKNGCEVIKLTDALTSSVHQWDDYFWIDIKHEFQDAEAIDKAKKIAILRLTQLFEGWKDSKCSFEESYRLEVNGYAHGLWRLFVNSLEAYLSIDVESFLNAPLDADLIRNLMRDDNGLIEADNISNVLHFMNSQSFQNVPYIDISCRVYAVLRKMVRSGSYLNQEKAQSKLSGIFQDVDAISSFVPYCDVIFVDSAMHNMLNDKEARIFESCACKVFSVNNIDDFHLYLDQVEVSFPESAKEKLNVVY